MALQRYQYQIGNVVFGDFTNMPVSKVEIQPWNVNNQDFQIIHSDEIRFGIDNLVPAPIVFTMAVLNNWALENLPSSATGVSGPVHETLLYKSRSLLGQLANEWKANQVRATWGAMKALLFADDDGVVRRIYGRPGKFQHGPVEQQEWVDVQCEFRRADTYAYEDVETYTEIGFNTDPVLIFRDRGDASAWFRLLFYGPINHPTVTIGNVQIELGIDVAANTVLEVSSYPWMRRIVDTNNINWRAALVGSSQYLDQLKIPADQIVPCRWTDTSYLTWTELPNTRVVDNPDFMDTFNIGGNWHVLAGTPMWGFSLQNGGYLFAPFGITTIIDNNHQYTTPDQYAEATIADIWRGTSNILIMCADDASSFVSGQVFKSEGIHEDLGIPTDQDRLRICTSTNYIAMDTQFEYDVPSPGLRSGDRVAISYHSDDKTCHLMYNGQEVGVWPDTTSIVNEANRAQGFIMNQDDSITDISFGVGLNNLVAYDASNVTFNPPPPDPNNQDLSSRVFLFWRETWNIV